MKVKWFSVISLKGNIRIMPGKVQIKRAFTVAGAYKLLTGGERASN